MGQSNLNHQLYHKYPPVNFKFINMPPIQDDEVTDAAATTTEETKAEETTEAAAEAVAADPEAEAEAVVEEKKEGKTYFSISNLFKLKKKRKNLEFAECVKTY